MAVHESFLEYGGFRYLKAATTLCIAAIVVYVLYEPLGPHNGGTWLGYTLGTIGFGLICWLIWLGVRKRQYDKGAVRLKSWVSAHVYLGLSLLVIGTLHTGFQFGWNVHTLAYALMVIVILSGIWGVVAYARYPALMTTNRAGSTLDGMIREMAELDRQARDLGVKLGDEIAAEIQTEQARTVMGGGVLALLRASAKGCPTAHALGRIEQIAQRARETETVELAQMMRLLRKKSALVDRIRKDLQYRALMEIWLFFHVPLSVALIAALLVHIISVFLYW